MYFNLLDLDDHSSCGAQFILDGQLSDINDFYWHADKDFDWIQIDFGVHILLISATLDFRLDTDWQTRYTNIQVHYHANFLNSLVYKRFGTRYKPGWT